MLNFLFKLQSLVLASFIFFCFRYMLALAQSQQCNEEVLDKFWQDAQKNTKMPHEKIKHTLALTLASLVKKSTNIEIKSKVIKWIVGSMLSCKKPECHQHFLRALKSTQSPSTIPILLKMAESVDTNQKTALLSLEILSKFDPKLLEIKIKNLDQHLLTLAKDPSRELSLKSVAIELILLTSPSINNLREIARILKKEKSKELTAIVLQKWTSLAEENPNLGGLFAVCVKNGWINWDLMSHGGLSTSFSRLLSQNLAGSASFTFNLEVSGMLMKRSSVDLNFGRKNGEKLNLVEVNG